MKPGDGGGETSGEADRDMLDSCMPPQGRRLAISDARAGLRVAAPVYVAARSGTAGFIEIPRSRSSWSSLCTRGVGGMMMGVGGATRGERKVVYRSESTSSAHNPPIYSAALPMRRSSDCLSTTARGGEAGAAGSSKGERSKVEGVGGGGRVYENRA